MKIKRRGQKKKENKKCFFVCSACCLKLDDNADRSVHFLEVSQPNTASGEWAADLNVGQKKKEKKMIKKSRSIL